MKQKTSGVRKEKKAQTSKAQKAQEQEVIRQRALVKDLLFPFLINNSKNITDAKRLCYEVQTAMTQSFQGKIAELQAEWSNKMTSDLPMENITKKEKKDFAINKALYELFKNEKISVANALIGGMTQAIDSFINEEIAGRTLESLKTTFL